MLECAVRPPPPPSAHEGAGEPRRTLVVAILGSTMAFLDGSVVNVALPVIQSELRATVDLAQWMIEAYALFLASLVLVGGALGDRLGRRRVFSAGVLLFAVASVCCGLAPTALLLVAARAAQGVGAALLVPGSLALISAAYPERTRGRAIGIWSTFTAITTAIGPVAGGLAVVHASWRWIFFFNVPVAALIVAIARRGVADSRDTSAPPRMDWTGAALVTVGLGAIVFALIDDGASLGGKGEAALLAAGSLLLVGFVVFEAKTAEPMVPLSLFRSRMFVGTNLLTLLLYGALGSALFFLPFNLIQVQGYNAATAGASLVPFIAGISLLSPVMGAFAQSIGPKPLLVAGSSLCAVAYALLAVPARGGSYWTSFFPGIAALGVGMGIVVTPLTTAVMGSVSSERSGVASGVNNAVSRAAGLVAVAALGLLLRARFDHALDERLATLDLPPPVLASVVSERRKLGAADFSAVDGATRAVVSAAFADAYVAGFRALTTASAILAALGALAARVSIGPSRSELIR
jgi:EmrB/QacA subfamily drug resistance transporter